MYIILIFLFFCHLALAEVSNCVDGSVRLIGGETALEGRVELCYNHIWGLICPSSWDTRDATVVCRQLGYKTTGLFVTCVAQSYHFLVFILLYSNRCPVFILLQ